MSQKQERLLQLRMPCMCMQLLRSSLRVGLEEKPLWARGLEGSALLAAFKQECQTVRQGLDGDLEKVSTLSDGTDLHLQTTPSQMLFPMPNCHALCCQALPRKLAARLAQYEA